jgi:hypothetical protein
LRRAARSQPAPAPRATLDESAIRQYSTSDFFYRSDELDDALDFMAVCTPG